MPTEILPSENKSLGAFLILKATFIFCLFSFKINILGIGEGGIRVDDIIMSFAFIYILTSVISNNEKLPNYLITYLGFILYSVLISVISGIEQRIDTHYGILFSLRLLQYLFFFFIGIYLGRKEFILDTTLKSYVIYLTLILLGQKFNLLPALNQFGVDRASGNTNGPYELAAICSFLIFYFHNRSEISKIYFFCSVAILWMTASRITTFAVAITFAISYHSLIKSKFTISSLILFILAAVYFSHNLAPFNSDAEKSETTGLVERATSIDVAGFINAATNFYNQTNTYKSSEEYMEDAYLSSLDAANSDPDMDASGIIRFTRWAALLKTMLSTTSTTLFGLGPSFGSIAVDGYITRLLVETGIFGFLIFLIFSIRISASLHGRKTWLKHYFTTLLISALFIDIFMSYKPMMLLWFALGLESSKKE